MSTTQKLAATSALETLHDAGFEAYVVGGAVRDLLLGRKAKDYDVTTNARPEQVQALFEKTIPVGAAFGVVVAVIDGAQIEIATYRTDGDYGDSRRPNEVFYSNSVESDVTRRDFTINGLLMGEYDTVVDHVGGLTDLEAKVIRAIGDPDARFTEDALRMLRAVRFSAQLGFEIESETKKAVIRLGSRISKVSRERIREELLKLLTSDYAARGLALLFSTGLAYHIFGAALVDCMNAPDMLRRFEMFQAPTPEAALAMFLSGLILWDADAEELIDSLKLSTDQKAEVMGAFRNLNFLPSADFPLYMRKRMARRAGMSITLLLAEQNAVMYDDSLLASTVNHIRSFTHEDLYPAPLVTGDDLIGLGLQPGKEFGTILTAIENQQLDGTLTTREEALAAVHSVRESK